MFDHRFLASKVGLAAMVSIAAMVSFNLFALSQQVHDHAGFGPHQGLTVVVPVVELA